MRSEFNELKRFAIADILSASGKQKTTETINMHINTIIDIAFLKGKQAQQSKVDELQYKAKLRESDHQALLVKYQATKKCWEDIGKEKDDLQKRLDALEKSEFKLAQIKSILQNNPKLLESTLVKKLEQALKGGCDAN